MKVTQVAEFLCVHRSTLYRMAQRGEIPAFARIMIGAFEARQSVAGAAVTITATGSWPYRIATGHSGGSNLVAEVASS